MKSNLLPTTVVGSHGTPAWLWLAMDAAREGKLGPEDTREILDDAVDVALLDMERAGVDIVTDGEMRRVDFVVSFYDRMHGLEKIAYPRRLGHLGPDQIDAYVAREELDLPDDGFGAVAELEYARGRTTKPVKICLPAPVQLSYRVKPGGPYRDKLDLAWRFAELLNRELKRLDAAGATEIQIDEAAPLSPPGGAARTIEAFNAAVRGVEAKIDLHICFGNFRGRPAITPRSYAEILPHLKDAACRQVHLEFANREMAEVELWGEYGGDKELSAGVIDVKARHVETPEVVADRIRRVLRHCPAEKLYVAPDCGFSQTARWVAVAKLKAMVAGRDIVRRELAAR
jgi:5-methyltetrahydropteroyltriglutamate--homocysteine methyltransferase